MAELPTSVEVENAVQDIITVGMTVGYVGQRDSEKFATALREAQHRATLSAHRQQLLVMTPEAVVEEAAKAVARHLTPGLTDEEWERGWFVGESRKREMREQVRAALPIILAPEIAKREAAEKAMAASHGLDWDYLSQSRVWMEKGSYRGYVRAALPLLVAPEVARREEREKYEGTTGAMECPQCKAGLCVEVKGRDTALHLAYASPLVAAWTEWVEARKAWLYSKGPTDGTPEADRYEQAKDALASVTLKEGM